MAMVSPLSLLLFLILTECCWASTNPIASTDSPILDTSVPTFSSALQPSDSYLSLEDTSSNSDMNLTPSLTLNLTSLMSDARDSTPTTEEASSTTLATTASELIPVNKKDPSSTQALATYISTVTASVLATVTMVATPYSTHPAHTRGQEDATVERQKESTTLVIQETTYSEVISANMTTYTRTSSSQVFQDISTSSSPSTNVSPANKLKQDGGNSLPVILVVVILVTTLLVALFLLWHQRQKRRTGALMLVGNGKHKGAGDAWAGPVQVREDQAASRSAALEGDTANPEGEATGHGPTLTTFFGKRKSRQGSVMLEDLEAGTVTNNPKAESEPLVENTDEIIKPPEADVSGTDGSVVGDEDLPSPLVSNV